MYAVNNVKKFLGDHPEIDSTESAAILTRAEELAKNGVFSGGAAFEVFGGNSDLADLFEGEATTGQHIEIGIKAIRESLPTDLQNPILVGMIS